MPESAIIDFTIAKQVHAIVGTKLKITAWYVAHVVKFLLQIKNTKQPDTNYHFNHLVISHR